jgi:hypothetical protein
MNEQEALASKVAELSSALAMLAELTGTRDALIERLERFESGIPTDKDYLSLLKVLRLMRDEPSSTP